MVVNSWTLESIGKQEAGLSVRGDSKEIAWLANESDRNHLNEMEVQSLEYRQYYPRDHSYHRRSKRTTSWDRIM